MPTLRALIDGHSIHAQAPPYAPPAPDPSAAKPKPKANGGSKKSMSPAAQHITNHLSDPMGATKEGFQDLTQKKLQYDQARESMQRELTAPQAVIDHLSQMHGLIPGTTGMPPTPGLGTATPGQDPNMMPGQGGMNPDGEEGYDEDGNPINMGQTAGKMNMNRPSQVGHQPGVAPGPAQSVVPPKMGMAKPGGPGAKGMPQPQSQGTQFNPMAGKPKGAGKLPGAKGPGDPKVANANKKAQAGTTGRQIKIQVHASGQPAISTVGRQQGLAMLKFGRQVPVGTIRSATDMGENDLRNGLQEALKDKLGGSSMNSPCSVGPSPWIQEIFPLSNYFVYSSDGKSYRQNYKLKGTDVVLSGEPVKVKMAYVKAAGSPEGAMKGWSTRGKGSLSSKEKAAHFSTLKSKRKKKMKAGPAQLSDKVTDPGSEKAYNPVMRSSKHAADCSCEACN